MACIKIFRGDDMNSIYKKSILSFKSAPNSIKELLKTFLDSKNHLYSFNNQEELIEDIKAFCNNNCRAIPKSLNQSNISRAMKEIMRLNFIKVGKPYVLVKKEGGCAKGPVKKYHFANMDVTLFPLFELKDCFLQDSVFVMSANTLVFDIAQDKHFLFLQEFYKKFSEETLWGHTSMGSKLVLMFNTETPSQMANFDLFKRFFEIKKVYDKTTLGKVKKN